jgi:hypothetical protein
MTMKLPTTIGARVASAMVTALWMAGPGGDLKAEDTTTDETNTASSYESQQLAAAAARDKDPAWQPTHQEIAIIRGAEGKQTGSLANFCVGKDGNLLACWSMEDNHTARGKKPDPDANGIRVFSPEGKFLKAIPLPVTPGAICVDQEGNIFVGGGGRLLKLDLQGKVLLAVDSPVVKLSDALRKQAGEMLKQASKEEQEAYQRQLDERCRIVTGMAVTPQDVFVACPSPNDFSFAVYRLDLQLANPKLLVDKLRGCCGQMDIQAHGDKLWIAHNARHRVDCLDRDGKKISQFGKAGKVKPDQFGGCCEPKNLRFTATGEILAAESGPPTCIKKFSRDGKFLGVVAVLKSDGSCVRVSVDVSPDGKRFYLLDTVQNLIRVFGAKGS